MEPSERNIGKKVDTDFTIQLKIEIKKQRQTFTDNFSFLRIICNTLKKKRERKEIVLIKTGNKFMESELSKFF